MLPQLNHQAKKEMSRKERIAKVAENYGLLKVIRWKPKNVRSSKPGTMESKRIRNLPDSN